MKLMGIHKNGVENVSSKSWKTCVLCLCSFLVSIIGGAILVFWQIKFHPTNSYLWMVPFGLVMFTTPIFIWIISISSDLCCHNDDEHVDVGFRHGTNTPVHDLERQC
ncbi:hypothetical protein RND81_01G207900 [Saponaria officinalis]|uniref:Transmembrane protein n=1 Tax=Saponaria officinalis TaxID=3572 RepID=A0AAW1NGD4_SAPOF